MNRAEEILALTVPCRYCNAKPFEPCQNKLTGTQLRKFGAHQNRINDAKTRERDMNQERWLDEEDIPF